MFALPDQPAGSVMYLPFDTYDSNGGSVTITGLAVTDIEIYKNGSVTQRASDNGYVLLDTDGIDFDTTTGLHGFSIDLADNSDAGFYAAGSEYWIHVNAITVDAQTVRFTYRVRLVAAESVAGTPKADVSHNAGTAITSSSGRQEVNVSHFGGTAGTFSSGRPEVNATHLAGTAYASADFSATMKTSINTEVDAGIETYHLDHLIAVADPGGVVANSSFLAKLVSKSATPAFSSFDNTTDSFEALRDNVGTAGAGLTAADDAVITAIAALSIPTANQNADALLDRTDAIETAITPRLAFRYIAAACAGKLSGAGTATEVFDGCGVATDRITATVDASGNRTAITLG